MGQVEKKIIIMETDKLHVGYNFSKYVNGTIFYKYILENDLIEKKWIIP